MSVLPGPSRFKAVQSAAGLEALGSALNRGYFIGNLAAEVVDEAEGGGGGGGGGGCTGGGWGESPVRGRYCNVGITMQEVMFGYLDHTIVGVC